MLELPEYWKAIAGAIDAEESKASIFIHHNHRRGVAREAILRDLLVRHTPEPYRVSTGFIYQAVPAWWDSLQCDVLVYDPTVDQPDYAIGGLVVVNRRAVKLVIEVKTSLDNKSFRDILEVHESVSWLPVQTLGFVYDGWSFETFIDKLKEAIGTAASGVPDCIAVHRGNYLFIRSYYALAPKPGSHRRHHLARHQVAVNFEAAEKNEGRASATFLSLYLAMLKGEFHDGYLGHWLSKLDLPRNAIVSISDDGILDYGGPIAQG